MSHNTYIARSWLVAALFCAGCAEGSPPVDESDAGPLNSSFDRDIGGANNLNSVNNTPDAGFEPDMASPFGADCDPFARDCAAGKCVPNASTGTSTCLPDLEGRAAGSTCDTIAQCESGTHCTTIAQDPTARCRILCQPGNDSVCTNGTSCDATLQSHPTIGICIEPSVPCDIYAQDCPGALDCIVGRDAEGTIGTFCGEAGARMIEQPCGDANGECAGGFICIRLANADFATCQPVCRTPDVTCPNGYACTGTAASSGVTFCQ